MKPPVVCWAALGIAMAALGFSIAAFAMALLVLLDEVGH